MESARPSLERLTIQTLQAPHCEMLRRAVANVVSSAVARETYAQIVDGLPLSRVAFDGYGPCTCVGHPLLEEHTELCAGAADEAHRLCSDIDVGALLMPAKVLRDFESTTPGSPSFATRLIELVARAVHEIAVQLYKRDTSRHKDDALGRYRPPKEDQRFYPATFPETLFCDWWYDSYDQYPDGVADSVGYWAENRILGGVILFDRRDPAKVAGASPDAIYIHPNRRGVTYRICRLLDSQISELVAFLLSEAEVASPAPAQPQSGSSSRCPLPVLPTLENRERVDPEEDIAATGIYRDPWERRQKPLSAGDSRLRDVVDLFNYVTREEYMAARQRALTSRLLRMANEMANE